MITDKVVFTLFLIFTGGAIIATGALFVRQSLLIAYIVLGMILGPWGMNFYMNTGVLKGVGNIGVLFLLFLVGLDLYPQKLLKLFQKTSITAAISSIFFALVGYAVGRIFNFNNVAAIIIAISVMFSSTIVVMKLIPTTTKHHKRTGDLLISILLLQDLIAIIILPILQILGKEDFEFYHINLLFISLPCLFAAAYLIYRFVLKKLFHYFSSVHEYIFLIALGWCIGMAALAQFFGIADEIGAFIAGVTLAASPISRYITESLRPLRDFCLVLFFFYIGASFDFNNITNIFIPALIITVIFLILKPIVFKYLLRKTLEKASVAWEVGFRLGQFSEFSLLIAFLARELNFIDGKTASLIQAITILSFIISNYFVVMRYPTPVSFNKKLRQD